MSAEILNTKQYYYLYKTTNLLTSRFYIGVHATNDLQDNYFGSGKLLKADIKKLGRKNFKKEILEFFDNANEMFAREAEIVNEAFVAITDTYNLVVGGEGGYKGHTPAGRRRISEAAKNKVSARNRLTGKAVKISKDIFDRNRDLYDGVTKGYLTYNTSGFAAMKDAKTGEHYFVPVDDPRIKIGELVGITAGSTQTAEANKKRSEKLKGRDTSYLQQKHICEFCGKSASLGNYARWHKDGKCLKNSK
jgi:hypothetical protein